MARVGQFVHDPARAMEPRPVAAGVAESVPTGLVVAALFLGSAVTASYEALGLPLPEAWPVLSTLSLVLSMIAWFRVYSRRHRIPWVMDMAWFLAAAWFIVVPYYILRREGRRGWVRIGLFCLTYVAAWATGVALRIWIRVLSAS
jgi:hypothetical protein